MNRGMWLGLLVIGMATAASAETFYVATDGNDENPGNKTGPMRTIQKAANMARAGDTILVRKGLYREPVVLRFSGQGDKPIVLKNYSGEQPVIQPGERGEQPPGHGVLLQAQEGYQKPIGWITIEGLEIRYGHDGVKFYNAHDIVIRNCHIHENYNQGILGNGNRVLIDRNIIAGNGTNKDTGQNLMHGIYATGTAFTITNNVIHSNTAYGIQVAAYDYNKDSMAGLEYAEAKNWLIANNTIAFNKNRAGIVIWQDGVENCIVQNNILYKNGGVNGILFYSQQDRRHLVRNNIFYPSGEDLVTTEDNAYEAIDNKQIDPRFVNADSFNFHLKADSPAIDAGSTDRAPKTDFEGKPRPQGSKVDIGAYEFSPATELLRIHPTKPKQHPVGMSAFDSGRAGSMAALYGSPADWIAPQNDGTAGDFMHDPTAADGRKVVISDTDHLWGVGGDRVWAWKSFTRGFHTIYMDPITKPDGTAEPMWKEARKAMGFTLSLAKRMNLAKMIPRDDLASSLYCLANPAAEYLVYLPEGGEVIVDLTTNPGPFAVEWICLWYPRTPEYSQRRNRTWATLTSRR